MAQKRAPLVIHSLDDAHVDLTPIASRRSPVEAPSDPRDLVPEPSDQVRTMVMQPLPVSDGTFLGTFVSLRPGKRERMVPYPIRLPAAQIAELERLRNDRGIIPAEFIRDAVAGCLELLRKA